MRAMFLLWLQKDPHYYVFVVVTVVFSIVLHELAHGWAALWQGDPTPRETGHMTIDPLVHMGPVSLLMLALCGMAFGMMPVNPRRFRHRYGHALVAAAGPLMNLLLALVALTGLAFWLRASGASDDAVVEENLRRFVWVFGYTNLALAAFNLLPVPPLDGSTVLAGFHRGYARLIEGMSPQTTLVVFVLLLALLNGPEHGLLATAGDVSLAYVRWLLGA